MTEDDLSADQRAALAQLAKSALIKSAAAEVVSIGRALFKDGGVAIEGEDGGLAKGESGAVAALRKTLVQGFCAGPAGALFNRVHHRARSSELTSVM